MSGIGIKFTKEWDRDPDQDEVTRLCMCGASFHHKGAEATLKGREWWQAHQAECPYNKLADGNQAAT